MPSYTFSCQECGENFTVRVSIAEKDKVTCPACGSTNLKQAFKSVGIIGGNTFNNSSSCGGCAPSGSPFS